MAKKKPMTVREKKFRAQLREKWREDGILPPVKKKLNRKVFAKEVRKLVDEELNGYDSMAYIYGALGYMLPSGNFKITPEEVGVCKLMRLAVELKRFSEAKRAEGATQYTYGEQYEAVKWVREL